MISFDSMALKPDRCNGLDSGKVSSSSRKPQLPDMMRVSLPAASKTSLEKTPANANRIRLQRASAVNSNLTRTGFLAAFLQV